MTIKALGVSAIAEYTGQKPPTVHQWIKRHGPDTGSNRPLPEPVVAVVQKLGGNPDETKVTYGWAPSDLPKFREWYARLKDWSPTTAERFWSEIDKQIHERYHKD